MSPHDSAGGVRIGCWAASSASHRSNVSRGSASRGDPLLDARPDSQVQIPQRHRSLDVGRLAGRKPQMAAVALAVTYLTFGIVSFKLLLNLTWPSAFYFAVATALTVGYGDIDAWNAMTTNSTDSNDGDPYVPTDGALLFTLFYILSGVPVIGATLSLLLESALDGGDESSLRQRYPVTIAAVICAVILVGGASAASYIEGYDWMHGLYWALVTMSTVGYGSGGPQTDGARALVALFMLVGVSSMGHLVGNLTARPLHGYKRRLEERVLKQYGSTLEQSELAELTSAATLKQLDLCHQPNGGISRDAFCLLMLYRTDKLEADDLRRCQAAFDALDADGSGTLDVADIATTQACDARFARSSSSSPGAAAASRAEERHGSSAPASMGANGGSIPVALTSQFPVRGISPGDLS